MNSLSYAILIKASPFSQQGSHTAYQFCKALLDAKHKIIRIFFYRDAVFNGNSFSTIPQDEVNVMSLWQELAAEHQLDLVICVTAAARRGILNASEAKYHHQSGSNLREEYKISGLGQLVEAIVLADRFIEFN